MKEHPIIFRCFLSDDLLFEELKRAKGQIIIKGDLQDGTCLEKIIPILSISFISFTKALPSKMGYLDIYLKTGERFRFDFGTNLNGRMEAEKGIAWDITNAINILKKLGEFIDIDDEGLFWEVINKNKNLSYAWGLYLNGEIESSRWAEYIPEIKAKMEKLIQEKQKINALSMAYERRKQSPNLGLRKIKSSEDLLELSPTEFEFWVKKNLFENWGWIAEETKRTGDGGVDIYLRMVDKTAIAQCKRFKGTVGAPIIRDFFGTLAHEKANNGYIITTGSFSAEALAWGTGKNIEFIDGVALNKIITQEINSVVHGILRR